MLVNRKSERGNEGSEGVNDFRHEVCLLTSTNVQHGRLGDNILAVQTAADVRARVRAAHLSDDKDASEIVL